MQSHQLRLRLRDRFFNLFADEAAQRKQREDWINEEAENMLLFVNVEREARSKPSITRERYDRMETCCMGHTDYHSKLALGCMELVLDED